MLSIGVTIDIEEWENLHPLTINNKLNPIYRDFNDVYGELDISTLSDVFDEKGIIELEINKDLLFFLYNDGNVITLVGNNYHSRLEYYDIERIFDYIKVLGVWNDTVRISYINAYEN